MISRAAVLPALALAVLAGAGAGAAHADYAPPLAQLRAGTAAADVLCNEGLILVIRHGGSPACVTETTAQRLGLAAATPFDVGDWKARHAGQEAGPRKIATAEEILDLLQYEHLYLLEEYQRRAWQQEPAGGRPAPVEPASLREGGTLEGARAGVFAQAVGAPQRGPGGAAPAPAPASAAHARGPEHSATNVQVKGVDEPDFLKSDGNHVYVLVGNELSIVDAYPAGDARVVFESDFDAPGKRYYAHMLLSGDRLAIIYEDEVHKSVPLPGSGGARAWSVRAAATSVMIVDASDRDAARVIGEYSIDGSYRGARLIGGTAYVVTNSHLDPGAPGIPEVRGAQKGAAAPTVPDVYYFDSVDPSVLTTVSAVDLAADHGAGGAVAAQSYLTGHGDAIYVSEGSIYLTFDLDRPTPGAVLEKLLDSELLSSTARFMSGSDRGEVSEILASGMPAGGQVEEIYDIIHDTYEIAGGQGRIKAADFERHVRQFGDDLGLGEPRTAVHKIDLRAGPGGLHSFAHAAEAEVPGRVLNQFSMDEHGGMFRVATTGVGESGAAHSSVFVLDGDLEHRSSLEGIAPGESIYSARFVGDRLYLVTFRQIDPFFVIELSGKVPEVLGELKIPGFSTYLHPYGRDGIIGIGRDLGEDGAPGPTGGGVKLAMFDISDPGNPSLRSEVVIGSAETYSQAEHDHRAVLVDEGRGMISLPVHHGDPAAYPAEPGKAPWAPGHWEPWDGFYVYDITGDGGFELAGAIQHDANSPSRSRSLYIEDHLYTVTDNLMVISGLDDLRTAVKSIVLN